jgi:RNA polymerase sigma-70 factor (ECF subfamily)
MDTETIDSVVQRVLGGEVDEYAGVVRLYQREVWKVVAAMLADRKATEDLVQQVFVDAYRNLSQYRVGEDFGRWIKSIARNAVRQELRRDRRAKHHLNTYQDFLESRIRDDRAASSYEDLRAEALKRCREGLPEHVSKALELRYGKSAGFEEIAEALGRTVEAARQMLSRVRLALRDCIEKRMARA